MKILVLSFYYAPDLSAGSFRTSSLVEQLRKKDVEIDVITTQPNRYASLKSEASVFERDGNITIQRCSLPSHKSGMIDQIVSFYSFYKQVSKLVKNKDYDLIYATSSRLFTAFLGVRIGKNKSTPVYLDVRDIFLDTLKDVLNPNLYRVLSPLLSLIEKYTFNSANHINLVSKGFKSYFQSKFNCKSYSFFTNGIDSEFLDVNFYNSGKNENKNENKTILYAGNMGEGQGLHTIIPALAQQYPEYQFRMIGDGGRKQALISSCKGINNVQILPPIVRSDLNKEYQKADILFLHLNDYDAFKKVLPSKLFEYGATGKPILAGVAGYALEFCSQELSNTAVFYPGNAQDASKALKQLSLETVERKEFIKKFQRSNIMAKLANSIFQYGSEK
ncbi:glycosyltransferase family 4 protein [Vibrio alginolyticus]|uniref:glycosyltransferase family 4 protein n=1 Tax=Vibrio alginolyticus TaxID=663 RepID=UPI001BD5A3A4|nr:glycosyltransferase family 4 protein [Vibrio alginolyticus]MBT0005767.1 glycosyltransferase family 4 protein [Vibrio alginolyticus]